MLVNWQKLLTRALIVLWGLQIIWLIWHFGPEASDLVRRAARGDVGAAINQEDPLYRWTAALQGIIPVSATYVILDDYAAGKEIGVRYHLAPRRHILLSPEIPASFLFYTLHQEHASFLLIRESPKPLGPGARAALDCPAFHRINLPGPGLVFRVNADLLRWGFYD